MSAFRQDYPDVNNITAPSIYPTYSDVSLGVGASAMNAYSTAATPTPSGGAGVQVGGSPELQNAAAVAAKGSPLAMWISLVVLLALLMWGSQKIGTGAQFSHIKLSIYNVLTIALAAIIGISLFKVIFTKFPVPGLTSVILSA